MVREASLICAAVAAAKRPALIESVRARLDTPLSLSLESQLGLATAVTARMLAHVSDSLIRPASRSAHSA